MLLAWCCVFLLHCCCQYTPPQHFTLLHRYTHRLSKPLHNFQNTLRIRHTADCFFAVLIQTLLVHRKEWVNRSPANQKTPQIRHWTSQRCLFRPRGEISSLMESSLLSLWKTLPSLTPSTTKTSFFSTRRHTETSTTAVTYGRSNLGVMVWGENSIGIPPAVWRSYWTQRTCFIQMVERRQRGVCDGEWEESSGVHRCAESRHQAVGHTRGERLVW